MEFGLRQNNPAVLQMYEMRSLKGVDGKGTDLHHFGNEWRQ